jgi:ribulose-bisphosphate carboxylase large chain
MSVEPIQVVYRVRVGASALEERVEALLLEQTVELPRTALRTEFVRNHVVGKVVSAEEAGAGIYRVTLAQPAIASADDPAQLLNLLFGNCSLQPDVELEDVHLPAPLAAKLGGPRFGIEGIRRVTGVTGRALTASVLKPVGLSVQEAADLCHTLSLAGIDIIKDDHGFADYSFNPFAERVEACLAATRKASQETGRQSLYIPNLVGQPGTVMHQAWQAKHLGAEAVMISPMILGLPFLNELAGDVAMPVVAHPAFGGFQRIAPGVLLGKLFRLYGADAVIFPNAGGRFSYGRDTCEAIIRELRAPCAGISKSFPVPAGGMKAESVGQVLEAYGADTILLIGGSLLDCPDRETLIARGRQFVEAVHAFPHAR